jgi:hypothetical protein
LAGAMWLVDLRKLIFVTWHELRCIDGSLYQPHTLRSCCHGDTKLTPSHGSDQGVKDIYTVTLVNNFHEETRNESAHVEQQAPMSW